MTPTKSPVFVTLDAVGGCPAAFTSSAKYEVGDKATKGNIVFECKGWPLSSYCSQAGYEPDLSSSSASWKIAWLVIGHCTGTLTPTDSPTATSVGGCPSAWSAGDGYKENDKVSVIVSTTPLLQLVYKCKAWPYSGHCDQYSPINPTGGKLGWEYVGGCKGTITPTSSPTFDPLTMIVGCPDHFKSAYTSYHAGDEVTRTVSATPLRQLVYKCNQFPMSLYCNVKAFAPGEQYDYIAWTNIGPCDGTLAPTTAPTAYSVSDCSFVKLIGTTPTPTPVLPWSSTIQYEAGDQVRVGRIKFECKSWPYYLWCHLAAYKPTLEVTGLWTKAWNLAGACIDE
jgi:hypothetical protein